MKFVKSTYVIFFILMISGCVAPGVTTDRFIESSEHTVVNEQYYDKDPGVVWDLLVRELSKSFFMINNIDKESRIINVSYSSDKSCDYIDCGSVHLDVQKSTLNKVGKDTYDFKICESNSYIAEGFGINQSGLKAPIICLNTRKPKLEGRMNIYVAPQGDGTLVTVNSRYILNIKLISECEFYAPNGNLGNTGRDETQYECSFDSRKPSSCQPPKGDEFICSSTGNLEKEILSLIH